MANGVMVRHAVVAGRADEARHRGQPSRHIQSQLSLCQVVVRPMSHTTPYLKLPAGFALCASSRARSSASWLRRFG